MKTIFDYPIEIIQGLPPKASREDRIALDTELFDMDIKRGHRPIKVDGSPNGRFASLACTDDGKTVYIITDEKLVPAFIERVEDAVHIWHNAQFDYVHMNRWGNYPPRKRLVDTMIWEQIFFSGYYNNFSLADVARRWLNVYLPKDTQELFETATEMDEEKITYAAYDVVADWHVYKKQRDVITKTDVKLWQEVDLPAMWTVLSMGGFLVDVDAWNAIADEYVAKRDALQNKYPDINLNSSAQLSKAIRERGHKLTTKTKTGKFSTAKKVIAKLDEDDEFIADIQTYSGLKSNATTYGRSFMANAIEPDGRLYANFKINGAGTGRMSCSRPNLQNVPNKYNDPRHRQCFICAPGNVIVVGDWSSQEPRIYAYLSQDKLMIDIFNAGLDIYIESARLMYDWELTKEDPRRNKPMKPTVLGAAYGLTEHGMEREYGIPKAEGREHLNRFFNVFTGARDWNEAQRTKVDYVETVFGRKFWLNKHDWKSDNNAVNSPVQGSASDAMKKAGYLFNQKWNPVGVSPIRNLVHDEIVLEVSEAQKDSAMECLSETMLEVGNLTHPGIKAACDVGWGYSWASKV